MTLAADTMPIVLTCSSPRIVVSAMMTTTTVTTFCSTLPRVRVRCTTRTA